MAKFPPPPTVIHLGVFDIDVKFEEKIFYQGKECLGKWVGETQTITLDLTSLPTPELCATILFHEINHALYWFFELDENEQEEHVVATLATGWATIWKHNPELLKWVQKVLK